MIDVWSRCLDFLVAVAEVFFVGWFVVKTTGAGARRVRRLMQSVRSPLSLLFLGAFMIAAVDCGADKAPLRLTSWLASSLTFDALGDAGPNNDVSDDSSPVADVSCENSECSVSAVQVTTNALVAEVVRVDDGVLSAEPIDALFTYSLTTNWFLLPEFFGFESGKTNAVMVIGSTDMPGTPTNMPPAAFVQFGRHIDSDADDMYDARELRLYGTAPDKWDTDGDGLGDGAEIAGGTDPLSLDSDEDGYDDDEERFCGSNPLVPDSGAQRTIRYYYDDDFLSATYFECHAVKMTLSHDGNAVRCEDRRRPVSQ